MTTVAPSKHIVRDERGVAWIDGKNVKVVEVVLDHLAYGWSAEAIHEQHPQLSLAEIHSALAHYYDHSAEFDEYISRQEKELTIIRATTGKSSLQQRLRRLATAQ
jgi:uncharacterized protein (DUF433 family)